jgi:hypothetical protein
MSPLDLAPPFPPLPTCSARGKPGEPAGGSLDVHDVLDDTRLPLVTAALSSARFPVIAPAARIGTSTDSQTCLTGRISPATVRDGGYIENTGMLTLDDLLPAIESATAAWTEKNGIPVHIVVLSIDDDPAALDAGQPVVAAGGGPTGIGTRAGPAYLSRLARDRIGSCQHARVTSLRASPAPHAGAHGATGWQLSRTARVEDLGEALRAPGAARTTVDRTRKILDGGLADPACP